MPEVKEFAFELEHELTKFVSVAQLGHLVTVQVRYGSDHIFQDESFRLRCSGPVEITACDPHVTLTYEKIHFFGLLRRRRSSTF